MTYTATYSPEDNKLRLTASERLPAELYARVKAEGFAWAPLQKIFIAGRWTPSREDLLLELAGEIGDEDTTLVDRAEERAERFDVYRENRTEDAERAHAAVSAIADGIPLGQPILIGHHSQRRAERDAEKIKDGIKKAVRLWDTANYWERRAEGAIRHAKYKERPEVRARRIKTLEAELRSVIASYTPHKDAGAMMQRRDGKEDGERIPYVWVGPKGRGGYWVPAERIERIKAGSARWEAHLQNRLAYERAMLAEAGGLAADRFTFAVGGRVLDGRSWHVVTGLNRRDGAVISLSVMGRFGGVPVEEVKDYRDPEEGDAEKVAKVKKQLPLVNFRAEGCIEMTSAEWKQRTKHSDSYFVSFFNAEGGEPKRGQIGEGAAVYRQRSQPQRGNGNRLEYFRRIPVFLTDAKVSEPPRLIAPAPVEPVVFTKPAPELREAPVYVKPEPTKFDALRATLRAGIQAVSAPQLFATRAERAALMVSYAGIGPGDEVLEPSAGTGVICKAILEAGARVFAVEVNYKLAEGLSNMLTAPGDLICRNVLQGDFLEQNGNLGKFDAVIMNPPFGNADDIKHIKHAMGFVKPGGRVVAICANGPRQQAALQPIAEHWETLPADEFAHAGTGTHTALLVIRC